VTGQRRPGVDASAGVGHHSSVSEAPSSALAVDPVVWPADASEVVSFLTAHEWPFHGATRLSADAAAAVRVAGGDVASFWIRDDDEAVGLIRLLDLDDVGDGSPMFDLRIATTHRDRGIGRFAVDWLTTHLFTTYPDLHRIEATTRADNAAMQAVFAHCGYRHEGTLVEAWKNADHSRSDCLVFAILRREFAARRR